jgi:hypothetical protein
VNEKLKKLFEILFIIERNLLLHLRVYYDLTDDHPLMKDLCELACSDSNLDLCYVKKIPALGDISKVFPMNWRFVPLLDPQVTRSRSDYFQFFALVSETT